jgi:primosomal protein N' (replication factor Y)
MIGAALAADARRTFLLHGVTGSGKTQVYIEAIRLSLQRGKGAIVLVPEISLTPQIVRRFNTHFPGTVAVVHSRLSPAERHQVWRRTAEGEYRVVIGPRSALFAPVHPLGLLVVDEEHESSYKQYDAGPRYQARDAALVRARIAGAVAVLGSATPSLESYFNAGSGKYELLRLPERIDNVPMPAVDIVDMREERRKEYNTLKEKFALEKAPRWKGFQQKSLSTLLREKITDRLQRGEGIILLQNRRGFAPFVECMDCGYAETCERCSVTLTYHVSRRHLRCHYCGTVYAQHTHCPQCTGASLLLKGIGTQRVEEELSELFPDATVLRMDLDTTSRKGSHERILRKFGSGEAQILLGTQMVAKGLDFPHVTLVGVISADTQMLLPDFRSAERTFQLLTQVSGRAGRSVLKGEVVIQTHQPDHYALKHVLDHDFPAFYDEETETRRELEYPPFSRLVLVECRGENEERVRHEAERIGTLLKGGNGMFTLLGPSPAVIAKLNNQYRWHIIIKTRRDRDPNGSHVRALLRKAIPEPRGTRNSVRVIVDVDPAGIL